ncbi:MAG: YceD family protein [Bacteroidota bacterium]
MLLDVASLLESQESIARISFCETLDFPEDIGTLLRPVEGNIEIERSGDSKLLMVRGEVSTRIEVACDRCGKPYAFEVKVPIDEVLRVDVTPSTADEVEESVEPTGKLNLSDLLRQDLILELPVQKLCGCPALGEGEENRRIDPRWSALETLKQQHSREEEE